MIDTVDTIGNDAHNIPAAFWRSRLVLGYVTGGENIMWSLADRSPFPHWVGIDQSDNPAPDSRIAQVGDEEPGAMTIPTFVAWCRNRHVEGAASTGYLSESKLVATRLAVKDAGIPGVTYGVANWNLSREQAMARLGGDVVWVQYASPTSNPDELLPGSTLTLKQANCDLGVAVDGWPSFHPAGPPTPAEDYMVARVRFRPSDKGWDIAPLPAETAA